MGGPGSRESAYEGSDASGRHFRRNFALGVANGAFYGGGLAFSESSTVLPVFVSLFTRSSVLIGLVGTLTNVGWLLPQLAVARYAEHFPRKMRLYGAAAVMRTSSWLCLALSAAWASKLDPNVYLLVFFLCLGSFSLTGGISGLAFLDIVAKTIPPTSRGRYFGYRNFFSGIIASLAGLVVAYVLGDGVKFPFPRNYFLLFLLTFAFLVLAVVCFLFVVEPEGRVKAERETTMREYLSQVRRVISEDPNFRRFLYVMVLANTMSLSLPFYVVYAREVLKAPESWVGVFLAIDMLFTLLANLAWGHIGDAKGCRIVIRASAFLSTVAPVVALLSPNHAVFALVFVLRGSGSTGLWLAKNNYVLEIAPIVRRPTYVGVLNTTLALVMLLPVAGGVVIDLSSYPVLFAMTAALVFTSLLASSKLREPRQPPLG